MNDHILSREVPVFNCIVNVGRGADGGYLARVANLPGIEGRGASERAALAQVVPAFKEHVKRLHAAAESIQWLQPPTAPAVGEVQRLIAVHL